MKKTLTLIIVLLLILPAINNVYAIDKNDSTHDELPDLVSSIDGIIESNNSHYWEVSIMNIGNVPSNNYTIEIVAYPLGLFLLRNTILETLYNVLPYYLFNLIAIPLLVVFRFYPLYITRQTITSPYQLYPGESYNFTAILPFDEYVDRFINIRTCIIIESIADHKDRVKESNEDNNRDVVRWWFPLRNEPPEKDMVGWE